MLIHFHRIQICKIIGKSLKQQKTCVLLGLLSLYSFCLGHAAVSVKKVWWEPVIIWMALVLKTGNTYIKMIYTINKNPLIYNTVLYIYIYIYIYIYTAGFSEYAFVHYITAGSILELIQFVSYI